MKRLIFLSAILCFCSAFLNAQSPNRNPNKKEPPMLGPHWTRGQAKKLAASTNNDLIYDYSDGSADTLDGGTGTDTVQGHDNPDTITNTEATAP